MIVGGLDIHRAQITFDWVDHDTGETARGQIEPAVRGNFATWLRALPAREGAFAVEATTGWRYVVEELVDAGFEAHLAEPAETAKLRSPKRRAKTDKRDARQLRELLERGWLPESWIPPAHICDLRETVRLRKTLAETRTEWQQRMYAVLYHHGLPKPPGGLLTAASRDWLLKVPLPAASKQVLAVGLRQIDAAEAELVPIDRWLRGYARRQPGCQALIEAHYGAGSITAPTIIAEVGDMRRFRNRQAVVRYTGLDITVYSSDGKRAPGKLSRQGPETLRWALYEVAKCHARPGAPHYDYYHEVKDRLGGKRATLSVARLLVREMRHTLIPLGEAALAPVEDLPITLAA